MVGFLAEVARSDRRGALRSIVLVVVVFRIASWCQPSRLFVGSGGPVASRDSHVRSHALAGQEPLSFRWTGFIRGIQSRLVI